MSRVELETTVLFYFYMDSPIAFSAGAIKFQSYRDIIE